MVQPIDTVSPTSDIGSSGTSGQLNVFSFVVLQDDVVNSNAVADTLEPVTGMSFDVVAGFTYWYKFMINFTASALTNGSRWTIDGPTATQFTVQVEWVNVSTSNNVRNYTAYNEPTVASTNVARVDGNLARIEGFITPSEDGTVQLNFAAEEAGQPVTAKSGSFLQYMRTL